jgi:hypothetical protein
MKASKEIPNMEFQSVGIPPIEHKRIPPNRIDKLQPTDGWRENEPPRLKLAY